MKNLRSALSAVAFFLLAAFSLGLPAHASDALSDDVTVALHHEKCLPS